MRSEWNCKDRDEIVLERERKDLDQGLLAKECLPVHKIEYVKGFQLPKVISF